MIIFEGKMVHLKIMHNLIILLVRDRAFKAQTRPKGEFVKYTWQMIQVLCYFKTKLQEVVGVCILKRRKVGTFDHQVIFHLKNWTKCIVAKWIF
jgi:hypothetical protein